MKNIVIIGNGISGITAARHIRKLSDHSITIISYETDHFFSRTALMYIYMGHMKYEHTKPYEDWFWAKNKLNLIRDRVTQVLATRKKLMLEKTGEMDFDVLILATGSSPNKFGWPGQDLEGVQGLYSYQDLELMEANTNQIERAVVIGGGLIGIEMAEMLLSRQIPVTFLVREKSFWNNILPQQESELINRHIREHGVDLRLATELKEIRGDEHGRACAVVTSNDEDIACQFVGLTAGVHPNIGFLKDSEVETDRGIMVDEYFQTNIPDIYAIGDCAQFRKPLPNRRAIEQVWYTGRIMGETLAHNICKSRVPYRPGPWFNSAKFFDIEYQTYGHVWPELKAHEAEFYWEHPEGRMCLHFVYEAESKKFLGINAFGIRLRHFLFDRWLNEGATIFEVLENLRQANFDPEFFDPYEHEIVAQFNKEDHGKSIAPPRKKKRFAFKF